MNGSAEPYVPLLLGGSQERTAQLVLSWYSIVMSWCVHAGAMHSAGALTTPSVTSTMSLLLAGRPSLWVSKRPSVLLAAAPFGCHVAAVVASECMKHIRARFVRRWRVLLVE
jgi:hypothetical protein